MGVPALFRWLSQKYPKIISPVIEEKPQEVDGEEIPIDYRGRNPNNEEFDNLYLDMNGIVHPCSHPENGAPPANEQEMMEAIFKYTDRVVKMVRPRKLLMIAIDGVAPRAKMNQQRSRRFRSAKDAKEKDDQQEAFIQEQKAKGKVYEDEASLVKKTWDSNAITPGTPFMDLLAQSLRYWVANKLNTDPAWEKMKIIISDASVPGEGEHKIMNFVRSQRRSPEHDPNTSHVIYGLDADLIMLGLGTHEPHFRVLREDVFFQESKTRLCNLCHQPGHRAEECKGQAKKKQGEFDEKGKGTSDLEKPFIWLHVEILREYLAAELYVKDQPFRFDLERALDDWVFMCFFVGNDFLPHLPSLDIREQGIDTLIAIWRDNIPLMNGYLTKDGFVDLEKAQYIMSGLAKQEDAIFKRRKQTEDRQAAAAARRKAEQESRKRPRYSNGDDFNGDNSQSYPPRYRKAKDPAGPPTVEVFTPGNSIKEMTHEMVVNRKAAVDKANEANKSAAATLKDQLLRKNASGTQMSNGDGELNGAPTASQSVEDVSQTPPGSKRKADAVDDTDDAGTPGRKSPTYGKYNENETPSNGTPKNGIPEKNNDQPPEDTIRLWDEGYADRYYEQKFKVDPKDIEFRHQVARDYVEGLCWVLRYYFQGCASWTWYYPHHYAPFAADFVNLDKMEVNFDLGQPFRPYEQLMGVMPAASNHTIPEVFRPLMTDEDSDIVTFYPEDFDIDLNGKKFSWQGVALLPFIDEKRLLAAMGTKYPLLTADEVARNERGKEALIFSTKHPLHEDVSLNFYSKKQGVPKFDLSGRSSEGLFGNVEKNENYIPGMSLQSPLAATSLPEVEDDQSISVHYEMPHSSTVHKSMILPGVVFNQPALDAADIQTVRSKASRGGRSYGGAPIRQDRNGGYGSGRGAPINYANPFAAHLKAPQGWVPPPPHLAGPGGPPPPPQMTSSGNHWNGSGYTQQGSQNWGYRGPPPSQQQRNDNYRGGGGGGGRGGGRGNGNRYNGGGRGGRNYDRY